MNIKRTALNLKCYEKLWTWGTNTNVEVVKLMAEGVETENMLQEGSQAQEVGYFQT